MLTIKGPAQQRDEVQDQTLRPIHKRAVTSTDTKSHQRNKSSSGKIGAIVASSSGPKSPSKSHFGSKFELPPRPDVVYREQSVEDFSDLFVDNDEAFNHRVNRAVRRVRWLIPIRYCHNALTDKRFRALAQLMHRSSSIHQT